MRRLEAAFWAIVLAIVAVTGSLAGAALFLLLGIEYVAESVWHRLTTRRTGPRA